jgi:hypothetical protein
MHRHTTEDLYLAVRAAVRWLDAANGRGSAAMAGRILKVAEESGEAAAAWIGVTGQNPRKGATHSFTEVANELADVVFAALVAIRSLGHDPAVTMAACTAKVLARLDRSCDLCGAASDTYPCPSADDSVIWVCVDMAACDDRCDANARRAA